MLSEVGRCAVAPAALEKMTARRRLREFKNSIARRAAQVKIWLIRTFSMQQVIGHNFVHFSYKTCSIVICLNASWLQLPISLAGIVYIMNHNLFQRKQFCESFYNVVDYCVVDKIFTQCGSNCAAVLGVHLRNGGARAQRLRRDFSKATTQRRAAQMVSPPGISTKIQWRSRVCILYNIAYSIT